MYDEASDERLPAAELAERQRAVARIEVREAVGNILAMAIRGR